MTSLFLLLKERYYTAGNLQPNIQFGIHPNDINQQNTGKKCLLCQHKIIQV